MSNIEKAAQAITQSKGFQSALPFGTPKDVQERHAALIAQVLADAGLVAPESTRTEWGVQHAQGFVSNEYGRPYTEAQARQKATGIEAGDHRRRREARGKTRLMTREVTEWEEAP